MVLLGNDTLMHVLILFLESNVTFLKLLGTTIVSSEKCILCIDIPGPVLANLLGAC